jgi:dipeptidase E
MHIGLSAGKLLKRREMSGVPNMENYMGESSDSVIMPSNIVCIKFLDNTKKVIEMKNFDTLNVVYFYTLLHHTNFLFKKAVQKTITEYGSVLDLRSISNAQQF